MTRPVFHTNIPLYIEGSLICTCTVVELLKTSPDKFEDIVFRCAAWTDPILVASKRLEGLD